jgi:cytochrome c oxidase assembly factor CtaG
VWAPVVETLPAPAWFGAGARLGYVLAVRFVGMVLGTVFVFAGPVYAAYPSATSQHVAGGVMLLEGSVVTMAAFAWFFLRAFRDDEARERLIESGVAPARAARAARYGRAASH